MLFRNLLDKLNLTHVAILLLIVVVLYLFLTNGSKIVGSSNGGASKPVSEGFNNGSNSSLLEQPDGELILYYANWCGYSRMFLPEWEKFEAHAKDNLPNLKVSRVLCEGGNEAVCFQKGVEGYPTVILYKKDDSEIPFMGDRTSDKLVEFIQNNL